MWHEDEYDEPATIVGPGEIPRLVAAYTEATRICERLVAALMLVGIAATATPTLDPTGAPLVQLDLMLDATEHLITIVAGKDPGPPDMAGSGC